MCNIQMERKDLIRVIVMKISGQAQYLRVPSRRNPLVRSWVEMITKFRICLENIR